MKFNDTFKQLDSHIRFRPAVALDALSITLTGKACSPVGNEKWHSFSAETIKQLAQIIEKQSEFYFVAERANKIIGFVSLCPESKRVTNLLIDEGFSKKTVGFELLKMVEQKALTLKDKTKFYLH